MDLPWLEKHLAVRYSSCSGGQVVVPGDKWQWLTKQTKDDGTTLLMRAAKEGATDCVQLLLMSGVNVNESRSDVYRKRRAIDFAIKRGHRRVVETLLQWDSILPDSESTSLRDKLKSMRKEDVDIKKFFEERNTFHELVRNGDISGLEKILSGKGDGNNSGPKYWVNSKGQSSLYMAAKGGKHDAWALLLSRKFESLETEAREIKCMLMDKVQKIYFDRAMGKYFSEVGDSHVFKLLSRTKVRGGSDETRLRIQNIYLDANKIPEAKLLMRCLQDDSHLEIIFELDRPDIKNAYSMANAKVLGVMDPHLHRVYASAGLESQSQVVSNLIHEFCHRVMCIVFQNNGLPYRNSDHGMREAYGKIVSKIMSRDNIEKCNPIIQLVTTYNENVHQHELIVRIPEIVTKNTIDEERGEFWKNDFEKELNDFYHNYVEKEINQFMASNKAKPWIPTVDLLSYPRLLSSYKKDYAQVGEIGQPQMSSHHDVNYLTVSDLSLGISHMEKSFGGVVTVDLNFFVRSKTYFDTQLKRGYLKNLVVVWDNETELCSNPYLCSCTAIHFQNHKEYVTLLIPKELKSCNERECVEYNWEHLSKGTKDWILNQHVRFQSKDVVLKDLLDGLIFNKEAESTLSTIIGSKEISFMIQQKTYLIGNDVESDLAKKEKELLSDHPQSFIRRRIRLRPLAFNKELIERRKMDAIFFLHTTEDELKEEKISKVRLWEGVMTQVDDIRHFFLKEKIDDAGRLDCIHKICEELRSLPNSGGVWIYAHFFLREKKNFVYIHSERIHDQRCQLLADEPGCGKSVYVHSEAAKEKLRHTGKWVEVVQLTECEEVIKKWNENMDDMNNDLNERTERENGNDTVQNGKVEDFLYQLIDKRNTNDAGRSLEKALFLLFCHAKERVRVYFDGFDEICPVYKKIISSFLEELLENTSVSFVVTTRTNQRVDLEMRLSTVAYSLVPFDVQEQVHFLNRQWNSMLKSLPKESREAKIRAISAKYTSQGSHEDEIISKENVSEGSDLDADVDDFNFKKAAEDLIEKGKPLIKNEGYFSEIPLHAYMMATVSFENDLFTDDSLNLSSLYKKFVDTKIELYLKGKMPKRETNEDVWKRYKVSMLEILKKFSVNLFVAESTYRPKKDDIEGMIKIGIVVEKEHSIEFIHRTFGEYLFCCRLLEEDANLRDVLFERVLMEDGFSKVRDFFDAIMLSERSKGTTETTAIAMRQSLLQEGKKYKMYLIRMLFYNAIWECREGILQYLVEIFREYLPNIMFMDSNDNSSIFEELIDIACRNAFIYSRNPKHMRIFQTLLLIAEMNNLMGDLGKYISIKGLRWTKVHERFYWGKKDSLEILRWIIEFFVKHKETLKKPLKKHLLNNESEDFFRYASLYDFKGIKSLMEAILVEQDFQLLLIPTESNLPYKRCRNLVTAWTSVVSEGCLGDVKHVWEYLESKLTPGKARATFLRRKDETGRNGLFAATLNQNESKVVHYVWEIIARELKEKDLMDFLFESFNNVTTPDDFAYSYFMDWLEIVKENKCLCIDDVLRKLLS